MEILKVVKVKRRRRGGIQNMIRTNRKVKVKEKTKLIRKKIRKINQVQEGLSPPREEIKGKAEEQQIMELHLKEVRPGRIAHSNDKMETIHLVIHLDLVVEKVRWQKIARESEKTNPESEKTNLESEKTNPESEKTNPESEKTNPESEKTNPESEKTNPESEKTNPESGKTNRVYTDLNRVSLLQLITRHNADQAQTTQNQQTKRSAEHRLDSKQGIVVIVFFRNRVGRF